MFQKTIAVGYVGQEPVVNITGKGTLVANFSIALSEGKDEPATWLRVSVWEKLAEIVRDHVHKGTLVLVEGKIRKPYPFVRADGVTDAAFEMTAYQVRFLAKPKAISEANVPDTADDIPF